MALESGTYISDLVATNPAASDSRSQGDDHLRLLKSTIKATFPNINGAMIATQAELNRSVGVTGDIQDQLDGKADSADPSLTGDISLSGSVRGNVVTIGAGTTIDCSAGNYFTKTMSANWTPTISNLPEGAFGFVVELFYSGGALTLPGAWEWADGSAPILSGGTWLLVWITSDEGATGTVAARKVGI